MRKRRSGFAAPVADRNSTASEFPVEPDSRTGVDGVSERGAFAFAQCAKCGWQGPGRRSRERARKDLSLHLDDRPKHADHVSVDVGPPRET